MNSTLKPRRKLVVKVGSSSIVDANGQLSDAKLHAVVTQLAALQRSDAWQVVLVSSGAIAAGLSRLGWRRASITLPEKQAAAAVGQAILMETYQRLFEQEQSIAAQVLLTRSDIEDRKRFIHVRNTLSTLLRKGIIPIVNENDTVAVDEIRFGDNDSLASLTALVAEADRLVLLTDIDGLYTGDPRVDRDAVRIPHVWHITEEIEQLAGGAGSAVGTGGMQTKVIAAKIAVKSGVDVVIAASDEADVLLRIANGEEIGTVFHAEEVPYRLRKSWLVYGPQPEGFIALDEGAVAALRTRQGSLLLPGVTDVGGRFDEGAVVELVAPGGQVVGKGLTNFASNDLQQWISERREGHRAPSVREVIHRNDMVMLEGGE